MVGDGCEPAAFYPFTWLMLNSRGAARRGAVRWVEIFGNFHKIVCMVVLSFFFLQKPELEVGARRGAARCAG